MPEHDDDLPADLASPRRDPADVRMIAGVSVGVALLILNLVLLWLASTT